MRTTIAQDFLSDRGWVHPGFGEHDICWLDCPEEATCCRTVGDRRIVLCLPHALVLEAGAWRGRYDGAPLPPGSRAITWPWQPLEDVA
jgi:hypothetical protein